MDDDDDVETHPGKPARNVFQLVHQLMAVVVASVFLSKSERAKLKSDKNKKAPLKLPSPRKGAAPAGLFLSKAERLKQQADKSKQVLSWLRRGTGLVSWHIILGSDAADGGL